MSAVLPGRGACGVVVQMRLDSSRLPRKALLPFAGMSLAEAVMRRLRGIPADAYVLATDDDGAEALSGAAAAAGFSIFAGPKDDVLRRFRLAADAFGLDFLIRATGDNPFVSVELAVLLRERALAAGADYAGFTGMPVGMGVEAVRADALRLADLRSTDPYEREHVCPHLYRNPASFRIERPACPPAWALPGARVTVDTPEDYRSALSLVDELGAFPKDSDLIAALARRLAAGA